MISFLNYLTEAKSRFPDVPLLNPRKLSETHPLHDYAAEHQFRWITPDGYGIEGVVGGPRNVYGPGHTGEFTESDTYIEGAQDNDHAKQIIRQHRTLSDPLLGYPNHKGHRAAVQAEKEKSQLTEAQQFSSAGTSQSQIAKGFATVAKHVGWQRGATNLDLGGGKYEHGVEFLKKHGVTSHVLDPYNRSAEHNSNVSKTVKSRGGADTVTVFNVLNTIKEDSAHKQVLETAKQHLKPGGRLFLSVYAGDKSGVGRQTKKDSWQRNQGLGDYLSTVQTVFPNAAVRNGIIHATHEG